MGSVVVQSRETSRWCSDGGSSWGCRCKRENKGTRLRGQARGIQVVARLHGENGTWGGAGLRRQDWTGAQGFLSAGQQTLRAPFLHRPARSKPRQMHSPGQALWGSSCHFLLPAAPCRPVFTPMSFISPWMVCESPYPLELAVVVCEGYFQLPASACLCAQGQLEFWGSNTYQKQPSSNS